MIDTISAEVGVEVGDSLMMACNKMVTFSIKAETPTGFHVEDTDRNVYHIPHDSLHLYLVVVK